MKSDARILLFITTIPFIGANIVGFLASGMLPIMILEYEAVIIGVLWGFYFGMPYVIRWIDRGPRG